MNIINKSEVAERLSLHYLKMIYSLSNEFGNVCFDFNHRYKENILNKEHIDKINEIIERLENQKKYLNTREREQ